MAARRYKTRVSTVRREIPHLQTTMKFSVIMYCKILTAQQKMLTVSGLLVSQAATSA